MVKSNNNISQHLCGDKGNILSGQLRSKNLENVMVGPIEIGKSYHKALVANYFGCLLRDSFEFHNSREGFGFLHNTITEISRHQPVLIWSKTDDIDLRAVGQAIISGYGTIYSPERPLWEDLRQVCRYRRFLIKHQTAYKNKIHSILDRLLPGITELKLFTRSHLWSDSSYDFFIKYPDLDSIKRLNVKSIMKFFQHRARRISPELVHQLMQWAKNALNSFQQTQPGNLCSDLLLNN